MSSEALSVDPRRRKWAIATAVAVAVIALAFYVGSFFIGHYLHSGAH